MITVSVKRSGWRSRLLLGEVPQHPVLQQNTWKNCDMSGVATGSDSGSAGESTTDATSGDSMDSRVRDFLPGSPSGESGGGGASSSSRESAHPINQQKKRESSQVFSFLSKEACSRRFCESLCSRASRLVSSSDK